MPRKPSPVGRLSKRPKKAVAASAQPRPESDGKNHRWVAKVKTVSTYPPPGLFTKDARTIARTLASKTVSPKGVTSGLRMLIYFINRAGKGLSATRRRELEKAKAILMDRIKREKEDQ
jgi:tRNA(adenine34) deaminase